MAVFFFPLTRDDRADHHGTMIGVCLDGQCFELAIALARGLGWPLVALRDNGMIRHVAVRTPEGKLWDARGQVEEAGFGEPFGLKPPLDLETVTKDELRAVRPAPEGGIDLASLFAQSVWPDLPWNDGTFIRRAQAFAQGLDELSRRYRIWIRAPFSMGLPVLCDGIGDESGYRLESMLSPFEFFIGEESGEGFRVAGGGRAPRWTIDRALR